jgi:hypothetical protein
VLISAGLDPLCVIVVEAGHLAAPTSITRIGPYSDGGAVGVAAGSSTVRRPSVGERRSHPRCAEWAAADLTPDVTRRPPERAPCLARRRQVTRRGMSLRCPGKPGFNYPFRMGDRRVGTWDVVQGVPIRSTTTMHQRIDAHSTPTNLAFLEVSCTPIPAGWKDPER